VHALNWTYINFTATPTIVFLWSAAQYTLLWLNMQLATNFLTTVGFFRRTNTSYFYFCIPIQMYTFALLSINACLAFTDQASNSTPSSTHTWSPNQAPCSVTHGNALICHYYCPRLADMNYLLMGKNWKSRQTIIGCLTEN